MGPGFDQLGKDGLMAASITGVPIFSPVVSATEVHVHHKRHIDPQAGRALEILGHAIEYLSDEYVHEGGSFSGRDPRLQAIQLLMARNRQIYFACPEIPSFPERWRSFFRHLPKPIRH
jgi:hypothetical protein